MKFYHIMNYYQAHQGRNIFKNLISKLPFNNEVILCGKEADSDTRGFASIHEILNRDNSLNFNFYQLVYYIIKESKTPNSVFIFHAINPKVFVLLYFVTKLRLSSPNVVWVCWGEGVRDKRSSRSGIILNYLQSCVYKNLERIIVLMSTDKESLVNVFNCNPDKVSILPYTKQIKLTKEDYDLIERKYKKGKNSVLIGHSANPSLKHKEVLNTISKFPEREEVLIHMFLNYSADYDYINGIINFSERKFESNNLVIYKSFLTREDYDKVFKDLNFFLSASRRQFGLAAIYNAIINGVTLYLLSDGANAKWMDYIGIKYRDINSLEIDHKMNPLSLEELLSNAELLKIFLEENSSIERWTSILSSSTQNKT